LDFNHSVSKLASLVADDRQNPHSLAFLDSARSRILCTDLPAEQTGFHGAVAGYELG